jgi:hypothetical protein
MITPSDAAASEGTAVMAVPPVSVVGEMPCDSGGAAGAADAASAAGECTVRLVLPLRLARWRPWQAAALPAWR